MNVKNMIQTHAHKSVVLVGPNHQPDKIARQKLKVESLAKDRQIQIEFQRVNDQLRIELQDKRFSIDRITIMENIRIRSNLDTIYW
jgi:hypothetical protein